MATCLVIDSNNQVVNRIVADPTDTAPDGCRLVELPPGTYWTGSEVAPVPADEVTDGY